MLDECIKALEAIDGCEVYKTTMNSWFVTWDGGSGIFSDKTFKLICYRVYNEVMAA